VVRVACLGNSMQYYNDCPRVLEALTQGSIVQESCFMGGSSFKSLFVKGNKMAKSWSTPAALNSTGEYDIGAPSVPALLDSPWDYVVMNDYTQGPAREESRTTSLEQLIENYVPLLLRCGAVPVLLVTPAYRAPAKGSEDLGDHEDFTQRLVAGYESYAAAMAEVLPTAQHPRVAPMAQAFSLVRTQRPALWHELFQEDNFHPSPHGTFLEAAVIHCTIFNKAPAAHQLPADSALLWVRARAMNPHRADLLRLPTSEELEFLCTIARQACGC